MFVDEKQQGEAKTAEQANRKMKVSSAIRIGAMVRPQCRIKMFMNGRSCSLGAAWEGMGYGYDESAGQLFLSGISNRLGISSELAQKIANRNDSGSTREQVADWLEEQGL